MQSKWDSPTVYAVTAMISGAYDVASFYGLPPILGGKITAAVGFLVFALSLLRIIGLQKREILTLKYPEMKFHINHSETLQKGASRDAIYRRIAITNNSAAIAEDCELSIESWTFKAEGLSADTPLRIKDSHPESRRTQINVGDTKQFDLFITELLYGTTQPARILVGAPNFPEILLSIEESLRNGKRPYEVVLRLTGSKFQPPRRWRVHFIMENRDITFGKIKQL